jgi:hypothetical protein
MMHRPLRRRFRGKFVTPPAWPTTYKSDQRHQTFGPELSSFSSSTTVPGWRLINWIPVSIIKNCARFGPTEQMEAQLPIYDVVC